MSQSVDHQCFPARSIYGVSRGDEGAQRFEALVVGQRFDLYWGRQQTIQFIQFATHSPTHPLAHSPTRSLTHSLIHCLQQLHATCLINRSVTHASLSVDGDGRCRACNKLRHPSIFSVHLPIWCCRPVSAHIFPGLY